MQQEKVKAMAAKVLGTGVNNVWLNPKETEKIKSVMTKEDVRGLVKEGIIKKRKDNSQSRARARQLLLKKKRGRKSGKGKRKGTYKARSEKKLSWMKNVRSQRKTLKKLREEKPDRVKKVGYRQLYRKIKGGFFKGKKYVQAAVEEKKR